MSLKETFNVLEKTKKSTKLVSVPVKEEIINIDK